MRLTLLICLMLAGCGMPETARAAKQADQAVEGIGIVLEENSNIVNNISDEAQRKKLQEVMQRVIKLVQSAKVSMQPVLSYLSDGKEIKVDTTPQEAAKQPDTFAIKSSLQAGRASVEVENRLAWTDMLLSLTDPSGLEGWLVGLSSLLLGSGTAGLIIARVLKTIRTYKEQLEQHKEAVVDAVAFGRKAKTLDPKDQEAIDALKATEAKTQQARGTKAIIDAALVRIKTHGTRSQQRPQHKVFTTIRC